IFGLLGGRVLPFIQILTCSDKTNHLHVPRISSHAADRRKRNAHGNLIAAGYQFAGGGPAWRVGGVFRGTLIVSPDRIRREFVSEPIGAAGPEIDFEIVVIFEGDIVRVLGSLEGLPL